VRKAGNEQVGLADERKTACEPEGGEIMAPIEWEKMAESHVDWFLEAVRPLLIMNFVHGIKHGVEMADPTKNQTKMEEW
jgi:hypothetical protein